MYCLFNRKPNKIIKIQATIAPLENDKINLVFNIIEGKGKKIKGIINNINLTISKKSNNFLFS